MTDFDMVAIHQVGSAEDGTPYSETQDNRAIASDASEDKKEQEEVEEVECEGTRAATPGGRGL